MIPQSSVSGMTLNVLRYNLRFRLSASLANRRLSIVVNSIILKSLRRSSFGLHKKA